MITDKSYPSDRAPLTALRTRQVPPASWRMACSACKESRPPICSLWPLARCTGRGCGAAWRSLTCPIACFSAFDTPSVVSQTAPHNNFQGHFFLCVFLARSPTQVIEGPASSAAPRRPLTCDSSVVSRRERPGPHWEDADLRCHPHHRLGQFARIKATGNRALIELDLAALCLALPCAVPKPIDLRCQLRCLGTGDTRSPRARTAVRRAVL